MDEDVLEDQRALIELVEEAGWDVTEADLSVYESPWMDDEDPEATLTLTLRKGYGDPDSEGDGDDDNPYRVK